MSMDEFVQTLPDKTECLYCHRVIDSLDWAVGRAYDGFMGICIVKCGHCNWLKIAAAGSNEDAHREAQSMRARLIKMTG